MISFLYSTFINLNTGEIRNIVELFGKVLTLSSIWLTDCETIGFPVNGEYGIPILA